jgi:hypothetical protein
MSAITGVYFGTGNLPAAARRQALRRFFSLFSAEAASVEASCGIALCRADGRYDIETAPPSRPRAGTIHRLHELLATADDKTLAVLGYRGENLDREPRQPAGRQPLKIGATIGVEDSSLTNAETLSANLGLNGKRNGRVGVTVRLIDMALAAADADDLALHTGTRLRLVDGAFAVAAWDGRFPKLLFVGKYGRELYALYDEQAGVTYFASRPHLLRSLFGAEARPRPVADNTLTVFARGAFGSRQVKIFPENLPRAEDAGQGRRARKNSRYAYRF